MTHATPIRRDGEHPSPLNAALSAAERGWYVFPLRPGTKRPALHGEEQCPQIRDCAGGHRKWEDRATTDPDRIRRAWADRPFNVGIATGPSRLLVVDLDMPKPNSSQDTPCGVTTFTALCERAGQPVPATYRTRTASGGLHLYFTAPPGVRMPNSAGKLGALIDTRAWGGYVVAPGSITPAGPYSVLDDRTPVPLPGWVHSLLTPPRSASPSRAALAGRAGRAQRYALRGLEAETTSVARAVQGERNSTLLSAARALGRFIAWGDLPRVVVEEALQQAGESAGLAPKGCAATIRSGLNWSIAHNPQRRAA
ncbi:bifunctional DNA primase/polymerase [Streptomyces sp. NBC_00094]|uniref:bifunctional DNA primase/polymerase n=1 Tax=Streptomyces sp. NBC_00094 TaxID=2903620 RepID=UPI0022579552|nr:bifunctional DNA primase/polymerase [Streptomyces sp. NBC_00094]MCX5391543.1 bifunctional DNA primase/polymerase [Streptomyces sp. NBC_00094]